MKYQSKKNPELIAELDSREEKFGTVILVYVTGEDAGKSVSITESTFKRWWKKYEEEETTEPIQSKKSVTDVLKIDYDKVNEPYPEPKEQKYIPKPQSVIDYENRKRNPHALELPEFETMIDTLGKIIKKVNKGQFYLNDKTSVWRKRACINFYATDNTWEKLTKAGLPSRANNGSDIKNRPYAFDIKTKADWEIAVKALLED